MDDLWRAFSDHKRFATCLLLCPCLTCSYRATPRITVSPHLGNIAEPSSILVLYRMSPLPTKSETAGMPTTYQLLRSPSAVAQSNHGFECAVVLSMLCQAVPGCRDTPRAVIDADAQPAFNF